MGNAKHAKDMVKWKKAFAAYKKTDSYKEFQAKKKAKKFGKKPKDKNAPKRASTAFFIFANKVRAEVREQNPEASIGEVGKILGQQWNALEDAEKQGYQAQAEKAKAKYQTALAKYKTTKKYAAYQEQLAAWKQSKKEAMKAAKKEAKAATKTATKKKIVKRKK